MKDQNLNNIKKISVEKNEKTFKISNNIEFTLLNRIYYKTEKCYIFPNGNFLFAIKNEILNKIIITNPKFTCIQIIERVHDYDINKISIRNNNFFATSCYFDRYSFKNYNEIKVWKKENNIFHLIETIGDISMNLIYLKNGSLISLCPNGINIYNEINNNKHQLCSIIKKKINLSDISDIKIKNNFLLYLNCSYNKNLESHLEFYNLKKFNIQNKISISNTNIYKYDFLDNNRIIACDSYGSFKIISTKRGKNSVVKNIKFEINLKNSYKDLLVIKKNKMFLFGGKYIIAYNSDNYQIIEIIRTPSKFSIKNFIWIKQEKLNECTSATKLITKNNESKKKLNNIKKDNLYKTNIKNNKNHLKKTLNDNTEILPKTCIGIIYNKVVEETINFLIK